MNKIGITCSTGKLGRRVYKETVKIAGEDNVFAIARNEEKAKLLGHKNILKADFNSQKEVENVLGMIDVLCFITSMDPCIEKRQEQNHLVIEAAKKMKVKKILLCGFIGIPSYLETMMITLNKELFESGITYILAKNGYYIEPDVRDIRKHISEGKIVNSAGNQKLAFTTRDEIAYAFARLLTEKTDKYDNKEVYVHGKALTQYELVDIINKIFESELKYEPVSIKEYDQILKKRYVEIPFIAHIVGSIYTEIAMGRMAGDESHFEMITGRKHVAWEKFITDNKDNKDVNE